MMAHEIIRRLIPLKYLVKYLFKNAKLFDYYDLLQCGCLERPHYGYCVYNGALLARQLGYKKISVLEFGVAGGNGLINLEWHAKHVSRLLSIEIDVYGFDSGRGLPRPVDYRDLPYHWKESFFEMDEQALRARLTKAKLVLGDVSETVKLFFKNHNPAPVAAIMHDLDYYSSTAMALKIFDADEKNFLPRVYNYFDDIVGGEAELYSDYTGARLAINEFNKQRSSKKISPAYHLLCKKYKEGWYNQIFIYHDFLHSKYNEYIGPENKELPLKNKRSAVY